MEIFNAILLLWTWIIILFQVFFIKYLQEKNEELLAIAKENLELAKNLKDKLLKTLDENILLQKNIYFLEKKYIPKCPEYTLKKEYLWK